MSSHEQTFQEPIYEHEVSEVVYDEVFFDAEHFFDGYKADPDYSLQCLRTAAEAGADVLILCDTRGGSMPEEIQAAIRAAAAPASGYF